MDPNSSLNEKQSYSISLLLSFLCFNQKQIILFNEEISSSLNLLISILNNPIGSNSINDSTTNMSFNQSKTNNNIINNDSNNGFLMENSVFNREYESKIAMCPSRQRLIEKYYEVKKDKKRKSKFISLYKSKEKMHRIDCMTRKINSCYYQFLVENTEKYQIDPIALDELKSNLKFTSKQKFQSVNLKYPFFKELYEAFLQSTLFNQLLFSVKCKYDKEYLKLFYNHAHNFLWLNEGIHESETN